MTTGKASNRGRRAEDALGALDVNGPITKILRAVGAAGLIPVVVVIFNAGADLNDIKVDTDRNCRATKALAREEALNSNHPKERAETFAILNAINCG